ncbi:hypothetical protein ERTO105960_08215 [Erysipelothrix tonsillarum]
MKTKIKNYFKNTTTLFDLLDNDPILIESTLNHMNSQLS